MAILTKQEILMRDVIIPHHNEFSKKDFERARFYDVNAIVEETMICASKFLKESKTGHHEDYHDRSDCKVIGLTSKNGANSMRVEISNVESTNGTRKNGALRVVIANVVQNRTDFLFIPKKDWINLGILINSSNAGRIVSTYHIPTDYYNKFEPYRIDSFLKLANKR